MKTFQPYIQQLDDLTFTHATTQIAQTLQLKQLEKRILGNRIAHLLGFVFELEITPTFTTAPTLVGLNAVIADMEVYDGSDMLFKGNGNDLRMFERLENGRPPVGEPVTQTSTNPRVVTRSLPMGPARMAGSPSDFSVPCAELVEGGSIKITPGVLTDVSADTTVCTTVVHTYALLAPSRGRLRVGPKYQRKVQANTGSGMGISDQALYAYLGAVNGSSYDAFTAADFSKVQISTQQLGRFVPSVDAEGLARCYQSDFRNGSIDQVKGEQRNDTFDVAPRMVNYASATALAAQTADLQPMLWAPPDCTLSKLTAECKKGDTLKIEFSGAQGANGSFLMGRFLPHTDNSVNNRIKKSASTLGLSSGVASENALAKPFGQSVNPAYATFDVQVSG